MMESILEKAQKVAEVGLGTPHPFIPLPFYKGRGQGGWVAQHNLKVAYHAGAKHRLVGGR